MHGGRSGTEFIEFGGLFYLFIYSTSFCFFSCISCALFSSVLVAALFWATKQRPDTIYDTIALQE